MERNSCLPLPHQALVGGTKGGPSGHGHSLKPLPPLLGQGSPHTTPMWVPACCHGMAMGQQELHDSQTAALWSACKGRQGFSSQG